MGEKLSRYTVPAEISPCMQACSMVRLESKKHLLHEKVSAG